MNTKSAKAKGRRLQQEVRDILRDFGNKYNLQPTDIESRGMGQAGEDVILSPAALARFPLYIECKNKERINIAEEYDKLVNKEAVSYFPVLVHSKNRGETLVTIDARAFFIMFDEWYNK